MDTANNQDRAGVWKEFEQNPITHSAAHHLMAIGDLTQRLGYARVSDVAKQLKITRGSVSISLQALKKDGLVDQDENRHLRLSPRGQRLVGEIKAKRLIVIRLLAEVLGVEPDQAEIDACKMEHLLSGHSARQMVTLLKFIDSEADEAQRFLAALRNFDPICPGHIDACPSCDETCLTDMICETPPQRSPE
jgi:Mn-dependent DtxR family transcriptional regulator